jgi:hypothetical protein
VLEWAVEEGDADLFGANIAALERLITAYQGRINELARLQQGAREIRESTRKGRR